MVLTKWEAQKLVALYETKIDSLITLKTKFISDAEPLMDYELFEEQVSRYEGRIAVYNKRVELLKNCGTIQ